MGLVRFQIPDSAQRVIAGLLESLISFGDIKGCNDVMKTDRQICSDNSSNNNNNYNNNIDNSFDAIHEGCSDKNDFKMRMQIWTAIVTSESFHKILGCLVMTRKVSYGFLETYFLCLSLSLSLSLSHFLSLSHTHSNSHSSRRGFIVSHIRSLCARKF